MAEIVIKTALQIAEEQKKIIEDRKKQLDRYVQELPPTLNSQTVEQEIFWYANAVAKMRWFNKAKKDLVFESDYQKIGDKDFMKKSGVKKLAMAFGISVEVRETWTVEKEWSNDVVSILSDKNRNVAVTGKGKELIIMVRARATNKAGVYCEAIASCSNYELAQKKGQAYNFHNIASTAETRATNRCIMNLLGGEVTAEEVDMDNNSD